jgi:hypothetical protein
MENTTSINDLPAPDINLPSSYDLPENTIRHSMRDMDPNIPIQMPPPQMNKPHSDEELRPTNSILKDSRNNRDGIKDIHKVIILATIYFMLFTDIKVKTYIINILVVIFGDFLRTSGGGTSKIGWVFYSIVFGISLLITVSIIDVSTYTLPF